MSQIHRSIFTGINKIYSRAFRALEAPEGVNYCPITGGIIEYLLTCIMWANFHTHSHYCDGKGALRDYLDSAIKAGIKHIGFSSHAPVPFSCKWCIKEEELAVYLAEIESLRAIYPEPEIYKGLEIDYIPGIISPRAFTTMLDYTIGSIHFVDSFAGQPWEIDNTLQVFKDGLRNIFHDNIRTAITRYFELTREMVERGAPTVVGHLDKIKIHNSPEKFFEESEPWYREQIRKTLKVIKQKETIVEVNTRGLYKKKSPTPYPSPWILELLYESGIPITLSSDAHHPDDLIREFEATASLLSDIGFKHLTVLKRGVWSQMPFNQYGLDG
jgi:histidinol-phosphatase (PHP family)